MRPAEALLPLLRAALPSATVGTWEPDVDHRELPYVHLRRSGGARSERLPELLSHPEVEVTVHHPEGLPEAEEMYDDLLDALFTAQRSQSSAIRWVSETEGPSQVGSKIPDCWSVRGTVRVGIRAAA